MHKRGLIAVSLSAALLLLLRSQSRRRSPAPSDAPDVDALRRRMQAARAALSAR
jgi:hypothetical protein